MLESQAIPLAEIKGEPTTIPETLNAVCFYLTKQNLNQHADKLALVCTNGTTCTYKEFDVRTNRFGNFLHSIGVSKGDTVLFALVDSCEYLCAFFGTLKIGAVSAFIKSKNFEESYEYYLNLTKANVIICEPIFAAIVQTLWGRCPNLKHILIAEESGLSDLKYPSITRIIHDEAISQELNIIQCHKGDEATIYFSSGTTGPAKGIVHTHGSIAAIPQCVSVDPDAYYSTDVVMGLTNMCSSYSVRATGLMSVYAGATQLLVHNWKGVANHSLYVCELVERYKITLVNGFPNLVSRLLGFSKKTQLGLKTKLLTIRYIRVGTDKFASQQRDDWQENLGYRIVTTYGTGELQAFVRQLVNTPIHGTYDYLPTLYKGVSAKILSSTGELLSRGVSGLLWISTPSLFKGYLQPDGTSKRKSEDTNGKWHCTRDIVVMQDDGGIAVQGREKFALKIQNVFVSNLDISTKLFEHPNVVDCEVAFVKCVVCQDRIRELFAVVELKENIDESKSIDELKSWLTTKFDIMMRPYAVPRHFCIVDTVPRNDRGKPDSVAIEKLFEDSVTKCKL